MRFTGLPVATSFAAVVCGLGVTGAGAGLPPSCSTWPDPAPEACAQPIDDVVTVERGTSYVAKVECADCPWSQWDREKQKSELIHRDQIFYLRVDLAHDNRSVLLNDEPIFPLSAVPTPPKFRINQLRSDFSNAQLLTGLPCRGGMFCDGWRGGPPSCSRWCTDIERSSFPADYLYSAVPTVYQGGDKQYGGEADQYWEVAFDVIAGGVRSNQEPQWVFDAADQKMLWMIVAGTELKQHAGPGRPDKAAGDLFGALGGKDKAYNYHIEGVRLQARAYTFPPARALTIWQKIGRFFGNDVWQIEGQRLVYRAYEWDQYGKKGTLRNVFGEFVHWDFWWLFWIVSGSTVAGLVALFSVYRIVLWFMQLRQLNKWDGMEDVWDRLRQEPSADEQDALLNGGYRDDPDEPGGSRPPAYSDEPPVNKPLPDKPLPDKPLPAVPLIDA